MSCYYKPLTPKFRMEIYNSINDMMQELAECYPNSLVKAHMDSLDALRYVIDRLPDGYLMPMKGGAEE